MKTAEDIPNISIDQDHEEKIHIKGEIKQEIRSEALVKVHDGSNDDIIKRSSDIHYDHGDNISIKKEIKQEIKTEPVDKIHDGSNNDVIKQASDTSNICFDHKDNFPIKKEIKQEIKDEPLDEDNVNDDESLSHENDPMIIDGTNDPKMITEAIKSKNKFTCDKCNATRNKAFFITFGKHFVFNTKENLDLHIKVVHGGNSKVIHERTCGKCGKTFTNLTYLKSHIKLHDDKRDHKCEDCDKAFISKTGLDRHVKGVHEGNRNYNKCKHCDKVFYWGTHLNQHIKSVHHRVHKF